MEIGGCLISRERGLGSCRVFSKQMVHIASKVLFKGRGSCLGVALDVIIQKRVLPCPAMIPHCSSEVLTDTLNNLQRLVGSEGFSVISPYCILYFSQLPDSPIMLLPSSHCFGATRWLQAIRFGELAVHP